MKKADILGQRFGRLEVIREAGRANDGKVLWRCRCDCGTEIESTKSNLKKGPNRSCGCYRSEVTRKKNFKHGMASRSNYTPEYEAWIGIKRRCMDTSNKNYGGRGISMCDRWKVFENFYEDMGDRPSERHSIDRIKNDGDYEPGNCKWSTRKEQNRNRRNCKYVVRDGEIVTLAEYADKTGQKRSTVYSRARRAES